MKIATLVLLAVCSFALIGCTPASSTRPSPGLAAARVHVIAQPKAGVKQPIARVAVYDAAPSAAPAGGTYERVDYSNLGNIIVWLEPASPATKLPAPSPMTLQIDPHKATGDIRAASVGQTIEFRNNSSQPINLYSVSDGNEFELSSIAPGAGGSYVAKSEGLIEVLADPAHPPIAQVYVAPSPWVARTRSNRMVAFNDVPPGEYNIVAWHPRLPGSTSSIALRPDEASSATVAVGVNALSDAAR